MLLPLMRITYTEHYCNNIETFSLRLGKFYVHMMKGDWCCDVPTFIYIICIYVRADTRYTFKVEIYLGCLSESVTFNNEMLD